VFQIVAAILTAASLGGVFEQIFWPDQSSLTRPAADWQASRPNRCLGAG